MFIRYCLGFDLLCFTADYGWLLQFGLLFIWLVLGY